MKKIYNSPKVLVVLLDIQKMVCASGPQVEIDRSGSSVSASDVESRRGSFYDEEE